MSDAFSMLMDRSGFVSIGWNGHTVYEFDRMTGILKFSTSEENIKKIVEMNGGLPIRALPILRPDGSATHFENVKEIHPLVLPDGTFFFENMCDEDALRRWYADNQLP